MAVRIKVTDSSSSRYYLQVLTMVLLVSPCLAMPRTLPWWTDACNKTPSYNTCPNSLTLRHGRSPVEVRDQIRIFIGYLKTNTRLLDKFYTNVTHDRIIPNAKLKRLNVNSMIRNMANAKKNKLAKFHIGLQKFARLLDGSVKVKIESKGVYFDTTKRFCFLSEIVYSLKGLLCEVSDEITGQNQQRKIRHIKNGVIKAETKDMTHAFVYDMTLLNKMERFLKASQKMLREKRNRDRSNRRTLAQ